MRVWILLICFLLTPAHAGAEEHERSSSVSPSGEATRAESSRSQPLVVERGTERFERALEARVGEVLAQRLAVAEGRAMASLERRAAGRVGEAARASTRRGALDGELAVVRIGSFHSVDRSR